MTLITISPYDTQFLKPFFKVLLLGAFRTLDGSTIVLGGLLYGSRCLVGRGQALWFKGSGEC